MRIIRCKLKSESITFGTSSVDSLINNSELEVKNPRLYINDIPAPFGVLDPSMVR